jgi:hypothetical protein
MTLAATFVVTPLASAMARPSTDPQSRPLLMRVADSPCEDRKSANGTAGTVLGALAGAAIGSNLARGGGRTGGAIIGGVAGAAVGSNVGRNSVNCDRGGYYYGYEQTYPYQDDAAYYGRAHYDRGYYMNRRCRMAPAPDGYPENSYVRVCPDEDGHYRIVE